MKLFAKLVKVDVEKRQVWGRATQEVPDKSGEIFDYESSVPLFRDWSASFEKATEILGEDGKSLGNIRAMHGKVAAGKMIAIEFNDAEKAIDIGTEIVDDAEWAKVLKGVYTGFSIGGSYAKQWKDGNLTRFTAKPAEISIVDNPCVSTATFSLVKADGAVEEVPFAPAVEAVVEDAKAVIENDDLARAAAAPAAKNMYGVATLASLLDSIRYLASDAKWEQAYEGDSSTLPAQLKEWLATGTTILAAMVAEEIAELTADKAVVVADLEKAGARHSKADMEKLQGIHDHSVAMGACCDSEKSTAPDALRKVVDLEKQIGDVTTERDTLQKRVTELEAQPEPPKGALKVVEKSQDIGTAEATDTEKLDPNAPDFSLQVMKAALARGKVITLR